MRKTLSLALALLSATAVAAQDEPPFAVDVKADRVHITRGNRPVAEYVFDDPKILRPYFANVFGPSGTRLTRTHPPVAGKDAVDHDTMHPGIWLAFGDVSGHDFWRNKARIKHTEFNPPPYARGDRVVFGSNSEMLAADGKLVGRMYTRFTLKARPWGWLLTWDAKIRAVPSITFGDQEEMGFGARVATEFTEKAGGKVRTAAGKVGAKEAWGQRAAWCDYTGTVGGREVGITLMSAPLNFREPWWHTRDYGVFVANPFGRAAMRQGAKSAELVEAGETLRLIFGASLHEGNDYNPAAEYKHFTKNVELNP